MMAPMKRLWAALGLVLVADTAMAQQAVVRSGEHDGFSRLVIDLPDRFPWRMSDDGRRRSISLDGYRGRFDLDEVFLRLSEDRLASVDVMENGRGIEFEMTCDCAVEVGYFGAAMLVVDISDTDPSGAPAAEDLVEGGPDAPTTSMGERIEVVTSRPSLAGQLASTRMMTLADRPSPQDAPPKDEGLAASRDALVRDISTAASMGLLNVAPDRVDAEPPKPVTNVPIAEPSAPPLPTNAAPPAPRIGFETLNASELMPENERARSVHTAAGWACTTAEMIAVESWGDDRPFARQMGEVRAEFVEDLDELSSDTAMKLARLYLYFGFGKEAVQIIEMAGMQGKEARIAATMASLIEQEAPAYPVFAKQMECDSAAALWSALASPEGPEGRVANVNAMLRALADYPPHLRQLLGPRLARSLVDWGRPDDADRVLRLLERGPEDETGAEVMARAVAEAAADGPQASAPLYEDVVAMNNDHSAEALVELVWTQLDAGQPIDPSMAELIESHAQELRGTDLGLELEYARLAAAAASGRYEQALDGVVKAGLDTVLPDQEKAVRTIEAVLGRVAENASDLDFLKAFLSKDVAMWPGLPDAQAFIIADRLARLGFQEAARPYLAALQASPTTTPMRLLEARIDLASALPQAAIAALMGVDDPEADALRAQAHSMMGDHRAAHLAWLSAGETQEAMRAALRAEAWSEAGEIADTPMEALLAETATSQVEPGQPPVTGQLRQGQQLLEQSEAARDNISELLEGIAVSPGGDAM